jgi:hypothetical protein
MNKKWQVSKEVISSKIDEEVILMSIEADTYFGIDEVGSRIWEMLSKQPASANELVSLLLKEYDVDEQTCIQDVTSFINEMADRKLLIEIN